MNNGKRITARKVIEGIKKGWTMGDFTTFYETTEEQLVDDISKLYRYDKQTSDRLVKQIKSNAKKKTKKEKSPDDVTATFVSVAEIPSIIKTDMIKPDKSISIKDVVGSVSHMLSNVNVSDKETSGTVKFTEQIGLEPIDICTEENTNATTQEIEEEKATVTVTEKTMETDEDSVEFWTSKAEENSSMLCQLEAERVELFGENRNIQQKLLEVKSVLIHLEKQLEQQKEELTEGIRLMDENQKKLEENKEFLQMAKAEQEEINKKIKSLTVVKIAFGKCSGDFDKTEEDFDVSSQLKDQVMELLDSEENLNSLSVQQLKNLSKMLLISKAVATEFPNQEVNFYASEQTYVVKLFEKISGKKVCVI